MRGECPYASDADHGGYLTRREGGCLWNFGSVDTFGSIDATSLRGRIGMVSLPQRKGGDRRFVSTRRGTPSQNRHRWVERCSMAPIQSRLSSITGAVVVDPLRQPSSPGRGSRPSIPKPLQTYDPSPTISHREELWCVTGQSPVRRRKGDEKTRRSTIIHKGICVCVSFWPGDASITAPRAAEGAVWHKTARIGTKRSETAGDSGKQREAEGSRGKRHEMSRLGLCL